MDKVYQVFVSSTYSDLRDERRKVSEYLAKDGFVVAGMELFPAADQQQLEFIKRVIDRCDYYVVIVGGRYGSLADENISFTEKEYEYALTRKLPVLAFLHSSPDSIEVGKTDKDEKKALKLREFCERLSHGRMVDYWKEPYELCAKIVIAVGRATTLFPGIGWVRGDQAIDPKVLQELERLRIENNDLKRRITDIDAQEIAFPPHLAGPETEFDLKFYLGARNSKRAKEKYKFTTTWKNMFLLSIDSILKEINEEYIVDSVAKHYAKARGVPDRELPSVKADIEDIRRTRFQLEGLGLIKTIARTSESNGQSYTYTTWAISEKGRRYMSENLAVRNAETDAN